MGLLVKVPVSGLVSLNAWMGSRLPHTWKVPKSGLGSRIYIRVLGPKPST